MASQTGVARLNSLDFRRLRALKMIDARVCRSLTKEEIATEFNVSTKTVERTLDWARRAGLVADYEDKVLQTLVPNALEVFFQTLTGSEDEHLRFQAALEVLKGTGLLRKPTDKAVADPAAPGDSLEVYIRKIRGGGPDESIAALPFIVRADQALPPAGQGSADPGQLGEIVDGELTTPPEA